MSQKPQYVQPSEVPADQGPTRSRWGWQAEKTIAAVALLLYGVALLMPVIGWKGSRPGSKGDLRGWQLVTVFGPLGRWAVTLPNVLFLAAATLTLWPGLHAGKRAATAVLLARAAMVLAVVGVILLLLYLVYATFMSMGGATWPSWGALLWVAALLVLETGLRRCSPYRS